MRKIIAIVGDAKIDEGSMKEKTAYEAGRAIIEAGYRLQCGALNGVMRAACAGARAAANYRDGDVIGIVPGFDPRRANQYVDIPITTGLDLYRNVIVANAWAVVAIGGGSGTLTEMANAWALGRMVLAYDNVDGWSKKLAGKRMDDRIRYYNIGDDAVYRVSSAKEMIELINERLELYDNFHIGIRPDEG